MRTLLRTTLITMLITTVALAGWSFVRQTNGTKNAKAASGLQVPSYCIPPELAGIQELLAKTTDPNGRQLLLAKEKDAEQAALNCAANATAHPPAPKPATAGLLPTSVPVATPTLQVGLQHAELLPVGIFIPIDNGNNMWAGFVNGQAVQIAAGSVRETDENWRQNHPDWQAHPELHTQGAIRVMVNYDGVNAITYPTPSRNGAVDLIAACGNLLILHAADNTIFTFDAAKLIFVNNTTSCTLPTP